MAGPKQSVVGRYQARARDLLRGPIHPSKPRWFRALLATVQFLHFLGRGFSDNRGPSQAAALSYTTLLALVPLLAVVLSVSKNLLYDSSAQLVPRLLDKAVTMIAPQLEYMPVEEEETEGAAPGQVRVSSQARQEAVEKIQSFIDNIHAGALGTVGSIFLVFVAIRLLMTIEQSFNDIWGIRRGRSIWRKVIYYWTAITLGPLLLLLAITLTGTVEFASAFGRLQFAPVLAKLVLRLLPFVVLWIGFSLLYGLMPNTQVTARAAMAGGVVGGTLWQMNNLLSTMYLSRVVTYSKIYGSLGIIPVFLAGLYFSWLIILFGAQVSFAVQNVRNYLQQLAMERIDQATREWMACRVVLAACSNYLQGLPPPRVNELAERAGAPMPLLSELLPRLVEGGILAEVVDQEPCFQPARPPASITVADVLQVVRTRQGICGEPAAALAKEPVAQLLRELADTQRRATANVPFSELIQRTTPAGS